MDSASAWQVAVGIAHRLTTNYEYDLLRHGGLLMVVLAIINIFSEDPDSRVAMVRFLFEKNPMCNSMPASEAGQQWSCIFGPASAFVSHPTRLDFL